MILIRTDANEHIGTGHVMRCMSISSALREIGEDVIFVTADERGHELISRNGFKALCLNSSYNDTERELAKLERIIEEFCPSLILADSYFITPNYFRGLPGKVRTAYIDDLNEVYYNVDLLINYNIFAETLDYSRYKNTNTKLLLSPKYAPLRKEFINLETLQIREQVKNIFVSAGGSDPENITERVIEEICPEFAGVKFHFVIGALNPRIKRLEQLEKENIIFHVDERNISGLMLSCDIAVSAAGSTLYELCACGIPAVAYTLADNQKEAAELFAVKGIMLNAGDCRENPGFIEVLKANIRKLTENSGLRKELSGKMRSVADGRGARRLAEELVRL